MSVNTPSYLQCPVTELLGVSQQHRNTLQRACKSESASPTLTGVPSADPIFICQPMKIGVMDVELPERKHCRFARLDGFKLGSP